MSGLAPLEILEFFVLGRLDVNQIAAAQTENAEVQWFGKPAAMIAATAAPTTTATAVAVPALEVRASIVRRRRLICACPESRDMVGGLVVSGMRGARLGPRSSTLSGVYPPTDGPQTGGGGRHAGGEHSSSVDAGIRKLAAQRLDSAQT
jgi:hypothetical protein